MPTPRRVKFEKKLSKVVRNPADRKRMGLSKLFKRVSLRPKAKTRPSGNKRKSAFMSHSKKMYDLAAMNYYTKETNGVVAGLGSSATLGPDPNYYMGTSVSRTGAAIGNVNCFSSLNVEDILLIANQIQVNANQVPTTGDLNLRFFYEGSQMQYRYTNSCNTIMNLELYVCQTREDLPTQWANLFTLMATGWIQSGTANGANILEVTPFQSVCFTELVKIVKVKRLRLEPGKLFTLRVNDKKKRRINAGKYTAPVDQASTFLNVALANSFPKGAMFVICKQWAAPCFQTGTGSNLTNPSGELLIQQSCKISYKYVLDEKVSMYNTAALGISAGVTGTSAVENFINPLTGAVTTYAQL